MTLELTLYAFLFIFATLVLKAIKDISNSRWQLPPSPWGVPIIGHLHLLGLSLRHSFHKLSTHYGPLISIRLGSIQCLVFSSPEMAKEFLKTQDLTFSSTSSTAAIDCITYNSSFVINPDVHYRKLMKKLTTVELLGSRTPGQFLPILLKALHHHIYFLFDKSRAAESIGITDELLKFSNNIMSQMMLSMRCSENKGGQAEVREATEIFGEFDISCRVIRRDLQGYQKRFKDINRRFHLLLENIIKNREKVRKEKKKNGRDEVEVKDFLDILLDVSENQNTEIQLTRDHIKSLFVDCFIAGTDSSAITVEWALVELINNPRVLKKALPEIDQVVGRKRLVEESDIPRLPYIQAIIKESFRIHPPIPLIKRKAIQECKIDNYIIPHTLLLFVNHWYMRSDPKVWKNPLEFQPERFLLQSNNEIDIRGLHYQLLPFGTGRRGCPGISLAMQGLPTTLAAMIDMSERQGLSSPRAHDLVCTDCTLYS